MDFSFNSRLINVIKILSHFFLLNQYLFYLLFSFRQFVNTLFYFELFKLIGCNNFFLIKNFFFQSWFFQHFLDIFFLFSLLLNILVLHLSYKIFVPFSLSLNIQHFFMLKILNRFYNILDLLLRFHFHILCFVSQLKTLLLLLYVSLLFLLSIFFYLHINSF